MKTLLNSIRIAIVWAAGFAVAHAQSITATATLSDVQVGSTFDYTLTLQNTGTIPIESLWYGWTSQGNNLPSVPSNAGNSLGWVNNISGNSIKYMGDSDSSLLPNNSATFTFDSTSTPTEMTADGVGTSVAYAGTIDFSENSPGDSSPGFSPTLASVPEPNTVALLALGLAAGLAAEYYRRTARVAAVAIAVSRATSLAK